MAAPLLLAGDRSPAHPPQGHASTIRIHYSAFDQMRLTVPAGVPITFVLVNEDPIDHEWLIGDAAFHGPCTATTPATARCRPRLRWRR